MPESYPVPVSWRYVARPRPRPKTQTTKIKRGRDESFTILLFPVILDLLPGARVILSFQRNQGEFGRSSTCSEKRRSRKIDSRVQVHPLWVLARKKPVCNSSSEIDMPARMFESDPKPKTHPQKPKRVSTEYTELTEKPDIPSVFSVLLSDHFLFFVNVFGNHGRRRKIIMLFWLPIP
uniref:Uncharacterized protein n=1 Tax=Candidatus Kentrum sp. DK TaxID=2126562 RepID=A0A450TFC7_9GAMM|nr:MAG: hypothetical protein BECKDK2373C_GA0170839_11363 [Candidatus Kentron sp. DK]